MNATATLDLAVSYSSSNTNVATINGNTVTIVGAGTSTITASQSGDASFNPASSVNQDLVIQKGNQAISFTSPPSPVLGDPAFTLNGTASSGLPVTYNAITPSNISISSNMATPLQAGLAIVRANQAGNSNYNAATSVDVVFCIRPAKPVITVFNATSSTPLFSATAL